MVKKMETTKMGLLGFRLILGRHSLYKIRYPKRRIYSYSILGTIVSPITRAKQI